MLHVFIIQANHVAYLFLCVVRGIPLRVSGMLGKPSTTEIHPQPFEYFILR